MTKRANQFLTRKSIDREAIKYIIRENQKTVIHCLNGEPVATAIPMKEFLEELEEYHIISIQKGIAVSMKRIVDISDDGVYTMTDNRTFQGRRRYLSAHKQVRANLDRIVPYYDDAPAVPLSLLEKCSLMDRLPVAFCVIELVFDANGHGVDFIFRYCNRAMEVLEGKTIEQMVNNSFYEVFPDGDHKWLVTYADVALNGKTYMLHDYSPEIDKELKIYCYQPHPGYCACVLIDEAINSGHADNHFHEIFLT